MNKYQFGLYGMKFSVLLTSYQMLFVGLIAYLQLVFTGQVKKPSKSVLLRIIPLGLVRSTDIGFGNAALRLLSVALQQIIKSTIPIYVCILSWIVLRKAVSLKVWLTLIPIVGGVVLASWGELSASYFGLVMAVTSCVARAGKAIINDMLLHSSTDDDRLDIVQIMSFESPISGVILLIVAFLFEYDQLSEWYNRTDRVSILTVMMYNSMCGVLMYLNQWSYISIIKFTSSVTCQVLMNMKMVSLIAVSVVVFGTPIRPIHSFGIVVATFGCIFYAVIKKQQDEARIEAAKV